jgi:hypothetical protein
MAVPFADATEPEVITRVLRAYVKQLYRRYPSSCGSWNGLRDRLFRDLLLFNRPNGLYTAALALANAKREGLSTYSFFTTAIEAARAGRCWRRCWYPNYKLFDDPRVTNRGVTSNASINATGHSTSLGNQEAADV